MVFAVEGAGFQAFFIALSVVVAVDMCLIGLWTEAVRADHDASLRIGDYRSERGTRPCFQRQMLRLFMPHPIIFGLESVAAKGTLIYAPLPSIII